MKDLLRWFKFELRSFSIGAPPTAFLRAVFVSIFLGLCFIIMALLISRYHEPTPANTEVGFSTLMEMTACQDIEDWKLLTHEVRLAKYHAGLCMKEQSDE